MTSILNGTAEIRHVSKIPAGAKREDAIARLHDHISFLHCDPHLSKLEPLEIEPTPGVPDHIVPVGANKTKAFKVTDIVHTIPGGIWDSNVVSQWEMTNVADGLFVRIKSPMSIVMDTTWRVVAVADSSELELVEEVTIRCSRLLLPIVKSQVDGDWGKVHGKVIATMMDAKTG